MSELYEDMKVTVEGHIKYLKVKYFLSPCAIH